MLPSAPLQMGFMLFAAFFFLGPNYFSLHRSAPATGAPGTEGGAPQQPPNLTSNRRLQQTQAQVDEVSAAVSHLRSKHIHL